MIINPEVEEKLKKLREITDALWRACTLDARHSTEEQVKIVIPMIHDSIDALVGALERAAKLSQGDPKPEGFEDGTMPADKVGARCDNCDKVKRVVIRAMWGGLGEGGDSALNIGVICLTCLGLWQAFQKSIEGTD